MRLLDLPAQARAHGEGPRVPVRHFFCRTCGIYPFHRKRVTPDYFGINVFCLEEFDPSGIPIRATVGAGMK